MEIEILDDVLQWEINIENTVREVYLDGATAVSLWYTATGDEGNAITVDGLENKYIISVQLNRYELEPVDDFPTGNDQYNYNINGTVTFKQDLSGDNGGDKIKIEYRAIV